MYRSGQTRNVCLPAWLTGLPHPLSGPFSRGLVHCINSQGNEDPSFGMCFQRIILLSESGNCLNEDQLLQVALSALLRDARPAGLVKDSQVHRHIASGSTKFAFWSRY